MNPKPLPENSSPISRVHAVQNQAAVWRAGEAFIKAHHMEYPDVTREHVTLQFLKDREAQSDFGFEFPSVLYHFENGLIYFLVVSRVPGQTLDEAWPNMDQTLREYYIGKIADVCDRLVAWKGNCIAGVDGNQLLEPYLIKPSNNNSNSDNGKKTDVLSPEQLLKNCTQMRMDISTFVFCHCDLGPTNILVDVSTGSLGIIDWEISGYVPVEWVRTKFRLSSGMDLGLNCGDEDSRRDWRRGVANRLGMMGYGDVVDAWWMFRYN
jgi:aminoglycoside phosphotransferase